jgi:metal-responsive CopG/Arc/MetJ family transcriptional regulator
MPRNQINIRVSSELLDKIDQKGKRSEVIRKALENYLSAEGVYQPIDSVIDKKIDSVIEDQKQILDCLEEIKKFQPIININYPESMLPKKQLNKKIVGFWRRLKFRKG